MASLHFLFPILLIVLGFWGIGLFSSYPSKVLAWVLFQLGWLIALFELEPQGGAMTFIAGGLFMVISLVLFGVLWALARQASPESPKATGRKGSP